MLDLPPGCVPSSALLRARPLAPPLWQLAELRGRLCELSGWHGGATFTLACELIAQAQRAGEPTAWLGSTHSVFHPPDAALAGIDLARLAVVRVPDARAIASAAELLASSGAFGVLVLDLAQDAGWALGAPSAPPRARTLSMAALARLAALARKHASALVCLTRKPPHSPALGTPVSLHAEAHFERDREGVLLCALEVERDKLRGAPWSQAERCREPLGLC